MFGNEWRGEIIHCRLCRIKIRLFLFVVLACCSFVYISDGPFHVWPTHGSDSSAYYYFFFHSYESVRMKLLSFHKVQFHVYRRFHVWSTSESILFRIIIKISCLLDTWKWSLSPFLFIIFFFFIVMKLSEWSWIPFTRCSFTFTGVFMFYQQVRLFFFLIIIELVNINLHCIYNAIRCIFHNLMDTKENCIKPSAVWVNYILQYQKNRTSLTVTTNFVS